MTVTIETRGAASVVTLRWTDRRNALGPLEARAVADAILEVGRGPSSALVITGEGAFCAGGDLRAFAEISARLSPREIRDHVYGDVQAIIRALGQASMPTIAAIDGPAVGLGMDIALACDTRFVGADGWLRQGWGNAGLISATGSTWFLEHARRGRIWGLLADQPKLDSAACLALDLAEPSSSNALESALARVESLATVPRDVLAAYAVLARRENWPSDEYLEACADFQSEFIGSERFRTMAAAVLGAN